MAQVTHAKRELQELAVLQGPRVKLDRLSTYEEAVEAVEEVAHRGPPGSWLWDLLAVLQAHEGVRR